MLCGPGHQNIPEHSNLSNSWREPGGGVNHVPESCLLSSLLTEVVTPKISPLLELLPPSQEDGQVWQQVGQTALAMHVTNSTSQPLYLFCSNSSSLEATLEGFQFSLSYFHCPAVSSTLFASYSHWTLKFSYSQFLTFFWQQTPVDVFSLPRCLLLFYWLAESLNLKVIFFPLPFAFSLCNPNTRLIGKFKTGSELFLIQCWEVELAGVQFCAEQLTVAQ